MGFKIVMVASEMAPFIKTGGLADVVGSLPKALINRGNEVSVILPKYSGIKAEMELVHSPMGVWMGNTQEWCSVYRAFSGSVPVFFIEHNGYFDRSGLYNDANMNEYSDNPKRFSFLCRAAMQFCVDQGYSPDIFHVHDWQTALLPAYLATWDNRGTSIEHSSSLLTIHNMAYQGKFDRHFLDYIGISDEYFTFDKFEQYGGLNLLKGGIAFAPCVNTVSPSYAKEVTSGDGYGLDASLLAKGDRFVGILNGVDYDVWSPDYDRYIPNNYTKYDLTGKWLCKRHLQERFGLELNGHVPILGVVGRFAAQKGYNILAGTLEHLIHNTDAQFVILGSGEKDLEGFYTYMSSKYPSRIGAKIGFDEAVAHLIEAGSDFFIMPSLFEPCGLNQIYSLRYGALPIVRATGGLNDTVENYNPKYGTGTGFKFYEFSVPALYGTILWAIDTYHTRPDHMQELRWNAMNQWFDWDRSAAIYERAYAIARQ